MGNGYKKIILVTGGTEAARAAEQTAFNLAKQDSATVLVVDTIRPPSLTSKWLSNNAEELFEIVNKCLTLKPENRFQTSAEVEKVLSAYLNTHFSTFRSSKLGTFVKSTLKTRVDEHRKEIELANITPGFLSNKF